MEFKLDDFLNATKALAMASDSEEPCERLNSFMIVGDKFDFENDYPAAKRKNPHIWSRSAAKVAYPSLVLSESADMMGQYKNENYSKFCHRFEIGVLDQPKENCIDCKPCDKRREQEIFRDTAKLLANVLNQISVMSSYIAQPGDVQVFATKGMMDAYVTATVYTSYKEDMKTGAAMKYNFRNRNATIDLRKIKLQKANLIGYFAIITVCDVCPQSDMSFKVRDNQPKEECC